MWSVHTTWLYREYVTHLYIICRNGIEQLPVWPARLSDWLESFDPAGYRGGVSRRQTRQFSRLFFQFLPDKQWTKPLISWEKKKKKWVKKKPKLADASSTGPLPATHISYGFLLTYRIVLLPDSGLSNVSSIARKVRLFTRVVAAGRLASNVQLRGRGR